MGAPIMPILAAHHVHLAAHHAHLTAHHPHLATHRSHAAAGIAASPALGHCPLRRQACGQRGRNAPHQPLLKHGSTSFWKNRPQEPPIL
ncbi:MAG TPA: hypothetical protein VIK18_18680 [Pirellulales bacterium]